jgi:hypothetical protein
MKKANEFIRESLQRILHDLNLRACSLDVIILALKQQRDLPQEERKPGLDHGLILLLSETQSSLEAIASKVDELEMKVGDES